MTRKEFLQIVEEIKIDEPIVANIENLYGYSLPQIIKEMVSYSQDSIFFDDGYRTLSLSEILEAEIDLHVDFVKYAMIPVIDCGDNDFVVYHFEECLWSKFNITDGSIFKRRKSLSELL